MSMLNESAMAVRPNRNREARSSPRLSYYISRTNGTLVPLVPADKLPYGIKLEGLPRILNSDQIFGMQHVSLLPYTGLTFKLAQKVNVLQQVHFSRHK